MATTPEMTDFSRDVLGRYVCNTLAEAMASTSELAHPGARPFDVVVVGGGSFGAVVAAHLFNIDAARAHRVLVLEAGPFVLPEHVQNLPVLGLDVPTPTSIAALRSAGTAEPRNEVWGLPWHSPVPFPGLAYCVGGRSLYWGGWAPRPLADELSTTSWPKKVVDDLNGGGGLTVAERQLGTDQTNDFVFGALQNALRRRLFDAVNDGDVPGAMDLADLPDHPGVGAAGGSRDGLARLLGVDLPGAGGPSAADLADELKLEAPLAVQGSTRPGFFPNNKFSAGPLLVQAARAAWTESANNDADKRLMIVPQCRVLRLETSGRSVIGVHTSQGRVPLSQGGAVVIALGAVESTRLALNTFTGMPGTGPIGAGLMAHLRSNLTIRIPREALGQILDHELMAAALFLKGKATGKDGRDRFFHLQITASGLGSLGASSEAELFKKIPDIDLFDRFRTASDTHVVVTLRGIGEMGPDNPASRIVLDEETADGSRRVLVHLSATSDDGDLWNSMDKAADHAALAFANGHPYRVLDDRVKDRKDWVDVAAGELPSSVVPADAHRDGLGTTHHEGGTLRLGEDPATSVTDSDCCFHGVDNAYAAGPALYPRLGSPNPMLTGVALARRLAEHLAPSAPYVAPDGYQVLFDGSDLSAWRMAGEGRFLVVDSALQAVPGNDLGLLWCTQPTPADFSLRLQYRLTRPDDNSGVLVRFPRPDSKGYVNTAWVPVHFGFEVQIDDLARPDGADQHRTGAIYGVNNPNYASPQTRPVGEWNDFEIEVRDQTYTVTLNGQQVTTFVNGDPTRGLPTTAQAPSYIGLQAHTGRVSFRRVRIQQL
ncbi:family 16 glycoside hydrolase [Streptomyces sp. NPDC002659]|uniref:family 16 glycoside hydrolase n=1 Tax=Streptomyces sp. NPDC002659 TaxID=3364656 RepID=UPI0036B4EC93